MKWHPRAVPPNLKRALEVLKQAPPLNDFYLAGGTAAALYLGHRVSVDLDFFSPNNPLGPSERDEIKAVLETHPSFRILEAKPGTLHLTVHGAEVSLFRYVTRLIRPLHSWEGLAVASLEDIALMKLGAVVGRGARKDFIDMYWICQGIPLSRILHLGRRKFPDSRDFPVQTLRALVYFDDAQKDPTPRLLKPLEWETVTRYFEKEAPKVAREFLR